MKELTIEQKAQAYDEAIKRGLDYIKHTPATEMVTRQDIFEAIFPELKESKDEKIRKVIRGWIYTRPASFFDNGISKEEILAWLERQGEHLENFDEAEKEKSDFVGDGFIKCFANFLDFKEGNTYWLEYMGDDKYNVRSDNLLGKTYHITPCQLYTVFKKLTWLEKQGEQKPVDKVKPKFEIEEGKWYVCTQTYTLRGKIVVIKGQTYKSNQDGAIEGEDGHLFIDKIDGKALNYFKPWIIQDAKDGDVLFTSSTASHETFILKSIDEKGNAKCYFAYDSEDGFREGKYHFIGSATNCKPATKEQRDTLFAKMKEAGYEWDADKKELKKIDTYCQENCKGFQETGRCFCDGECKAKKEHIKQNLQDNNFRRIEQNSAWSEEDESKMNNLCHFLEEYGNQYYGHLTLQGSISWLKSLKDRPQWKPSELQIEALESATANCAYSEYEDCLKELIKQLKQL